VAVPEFGRQTRTQMLLLWSACRLEILCLMRDYGKREVASLAGRNWELGELFSLTGPPQIRGLFLPQKIFDPSLLVGAAVCFGWIPREFFIHNRIAVPKGLGPIFAELGLSAE